MWRIPNPTESGTFSDFAHEICIRRMRILAGSVTSYYSLVLVCNKSSNRALEKVKLTTRNCSHLFVGTLLGESTWGIFTREISRRIYGSVEVGCEWCRIWEGLPVIYLSSINHLFKCLWYIFDIFTCVLVIFVSLDRICTYCGPKNNFITAVTLSTLHQVSIFLADTHHRKFTTRQCIVSPPNMVCVTALPCKILTHNFVYACTCKIA